MTLIATNSTAIEISAMIAAARRDSFSIGALPSIRLLEIDQDGVGEEEDADYRQEEHRVAQVDDAADDRVEMREEAERGHCLQHRLRCPAVEEAQHDGGAAHGKDEAHGGGDHEGDHLILGER